MEVWLCLNHNRDAVLCILGTRTGPICCQNYPAKVPSQSRSVILVALISRNHDGWCIVCNFRPLHNMDLIAIFHCPSHLITVITIHWGTTGWRCCDFHKASARENVVEIAHIPCITWPHRPKSKYIHFTPSRTIIQSNDNSASPWTWSWPRHEQANIAGTSMYFR
jgi:hypothetical protein